MKVRPYILAGGRSSRMGRDKAMLTLRGRTLLGHVVSTIRTVSSLKIDGQKAEITVVGDRTELGGADRNIVDIYPGCGPLGGMEAALRDLREAEASDSVGEVEWAFFLPVDMPFLPAGLIDALLIEWMDATRLGAKVCYIVVDGCTQPLVSMMHRSLHPFLIEALTAGQFKVTAVLHRAAETVATPEGFGIAYRHAAVHTTLVKLEGTVPAVAGWRATEEQERSKFLWFSNLNTEEEFHEAETFLSLMGSG